MEKNVNEIKSIIERAPNILSVTILRTRVIPPAACIVISFNSEIIQTRAIFIARPYLSSLANIYIFS